MFVEIEKRWQEEIQKIDRGLFIVWHEEFGMLQIKHKDDRTGLVRNVCFVKDKDGNPCNLDMSHIRYLRNSVEWERIGKDADPDKLYAGIVKDIKEAEMKRDLERRGYVLDFNKDHRQDWKRAMNKFVESLPPWQLKLMKKKAEMQREREKIIRVGYSGGIR